MTKEEIKQLYSMSDMVARYSLKKNRAGFVCCPFHQGDREASMKIYEKDYHCFGCGENGDIFSFVMKMDGLTFQEAFQALGGTYQKPDFKTGLAIYRANKRRQMALRQAEKRKEEKSLNNLLISVYRRNIDQSVPLSEAWCDSYNALQYQLYRLEELNKMR